MNKSRLCLCLFLLGALPAFSQTSLPTAFTLPQVEQNLTEFIGRQMDKEHVKGLSIALVDGKEIVWARGFGYADDSRKIPATSDTLYRVGAVSKILTAAEVLKLAEEGKVGLDRPLSRYLPGFSVHSRFKRAKAITVRSLLANHSGLPGFFLKGLWVEKPESLKALVEELKSDYLVAPPQTFYKYSYVDYDLLGRLVELRKKEDFAAALRRDLLEPLGMVSSSFGNDLPAGAVLAKSYRKGNEMAPFYLRDIPAAGLVSSVSDLARFVRYLFGGGPSGDKPFGQKTIDTLFEPQYPDLPMDFGRRVAMGWLMGGLQVEGSESTAWHDGEYPPYVSEVVVLDKQKLGVVVLSNTQEASRVIDDISVCALKLLLRSKYGMAENLEKKKIEMPKTVEVPAGILDRYAGTYSALGQLTKITRQDKHLAADLSGHQLDLLPVSQDTFIPHLVFLLLFPVDLPQYPLTFSSSRGQDMAVLGGLHYPLPLQKIRPVEIPEAWKEREGDYVLENPDGQIDFESVSLGEKDGFLAAAMKVSFKAFDVKDRDFKVALLPLSGEDAMVPGLFYGDGGTLHAVEGEDGTRIFYSGYWFKKVVDPDSPSPTAAKPEK